MLTRLRFEHSRHDFKIVFLGGGRLKSELAVFDLGFFEEIEDLKYSYKKLKREAEKLAKKEVR